MYWMEFKRTEEETSHFTKHTEKAFGTPDLWDCVIPTVPGSSRPHSIIVANVADAILKNTPLIAPMEEGINGLELGNSMLLSGLKGKTVELPMDSAEYAAELEKLVSKSRYPKKANKKSVNVEGFNSSF